MSDFPVEFENRLKSDGLGSLLDALNGSSPISIRCNQFKKCDLDFDLCPIEWCEDGFYISGDRPKFTLDPFIHGGGYYVQEASSMIVGEIARKYSPKMVLDLCAAPGGKTTHLASVVGSDGCVVANEVIRSRASILSENVQKWGSGNVIVTSSDAKNFGMLDGLFDIVVADVPCSGEGMFRKDVQSRQQWSVENVELCAARGRRIVSDAWNALKEGGIFIYSTCTFNEQENQENVKWICQNLEAEMELFEIPTGAVESQCGVNFYPHMIQGEGFFIAVLRKTSLLDYYFLENKTTLKKVDRNIISELRKWTNGELEYRVGGGSIYGYNSKSATIIDQLMGLNVVYSGIEMGTIIRDELKPAHSLALYHDVKCDNISDIDLNEALQFLAKSALNESCYKDGLGLVRYKGVGLGWAKAVAKGSGKRINNLYPQGWRILNL